ncbi:MAG: tetratricopeptide repeat protein [Deltaproteobacteria bacterium]|nr:tetratricopeptide repeat protein [Deltaproteobacteria bacterium]
MRIIFIIVLLTTLTVSSAFAGTESAQSAFEEGAALFEHREYSKAAAAFRKAYKIKPSWKILYNIAQCETAAGQYGRALEDFETFLAQGADEITLKRRNEVEAELDRLRKLVGFVEIKAPEGAIVFINGEERGTCPLPGKLMVAASVVHELKIVDGGEELLNRNIQVGGTQFITIEANGESDDETVRNSSDTPAETEHMPENALVSTPATQHNPLKIAGIITASVGGALMISGLVTGKLTLSKANQLEDNCDGKKDCDESNKDMYDRAESLATATNVLLATGSALAITGVIFAIVGHKKESSKEKLVVQTTPLIGQTFMGIAVHGSF